MRARSRTAGWSQGAGRSSHSSFIPATTVRDEESAYFEVMRENKRRMYKRIEAKAEQKKKEITLPKFSWDK